MIDRLFDIIIAAYRKLRSVKKEMIESMYYVVTPRRLSEKGYDLLSVLTPEDYEKLCSSYEENVETMFIVDKIKVTITVERYENDK